LRSDVPSFLYSRLCARPSSSVSPLPSPTVHPRCSFFIASLPFFSSSLREPVPLLLETFFLLYLFGCYFPLLIGLLNPELTRGTVPIAFFYYPLWHVHDVALPYSAFPWQSNCQDLKFFPVFTACSGCRSSPLRNGLRVLASRLLFLFIQRVLFLPLFLLLALYKSFRRKLLTFIARCLLLVPINRYETFFFSLLPVLD